MKTSLRNKLTKFGALFLGLAMGLGVAVGVTAGNNKAMEVRADTKTWDLTKASYSSSSDNSVVYSNAAVTITIAKGNGTNANNYLGGSNAHTRWYNGNLLIVSSNDGYVVSAFSITATTASYLKFEKGSDCTVSTSGTVLTATADSGKTSFTLKGNGTGRYTSMTVTYTQGATKTLTGVEITGNLLKTAYTTEDSAWDFTGLKATGTYDTQETEDITSSVTWSAIPNAPTEGTTSISVVASLGDISSSDYSQTVTVTEPNYVKFVAGTDTSDGKTITKGNVTLAATTFNNTGYYQAYSGTDLVVSTTDESYIETIEIICTGSGTSNYSPSKFSSVSTGNYSYSGTIGTWVGKATSVSFQNSAQVRMTQIKVFLEAPKTLVSIAVTGAPSKTSYAVGESFDCAGLVATGTYDDESTKDISSDVSWVPNPTTISEGTTSVSVTASLGSVVSESYPVNITLLENYSVTFDFNGHGTNYVLDNVIAGSKIEEPQTPTADGFAFNGWFDANGNKWDFSNDTVDGDITLTAHWLNSSTSENPLSVSEAIALIDSNNSALLSIDQYVVGIVFKVDKIESNKINYWISDDGTDTNGFEVYHGKGLNGANFNSIDEVEVGAKYVIKGRLTKYYTTYEFSDSSSIVKEVDQYFSISFYGNGADNGSMETIENQARKSEYHLPTPSFTYTGKEFAGWKVNDEEEIRSVGDKIIILGNVTLTAQWSNKYNINFSNSEGIGSMTGISVTSPYTLPECTITAPDGKGFKGYTVGSVDSNTYYQADDQIVLTTDTTIYVHFDFLYTVSYTDGTLVVSDTHGAYLNGSLVTVLDNEFTPVGIKSFDYWVDEDGNQYKPGETFNISGNVVLSANWKDVNPVVTYQVTSTTTVEATGYAPTNSSCTFKNTYNNNKEQLTSGNSQTYTLSGYDGYIITGITLSMHSNSKAGAGKFSVVAGSTTILASISETTFNKWYNNTSYGTDYRDVIVDLTNENYVIKNDENIVIKIEGTTNSIFCESITIEWGENVTLDEELRIENEENLNKNFILGNPFSIGDVDIYADYSDNTSVEVTDSVSSLISSDNGITWEEISSLNCGSFKIKLSYTDEKSRTSTYIYSIEVNYANVENVTITTSTQALSLDSSFTFEASVTPTNANAKVIWSVCNASGSNIDTDEFEINQTTGKLTVKTETSGTLVVTATSVVDNSKSDSVTVVISGAPIVKIYSGEDIVSETQIDKFSTDNNFVLDVVGENFISEMNYEWSCSNNDENDSVSILSGNTTNSCMFTINHTGTTTITCVVSSELGGTETSYVTINVTDPVVSKVEWDATEICLYTGQSITDEIIKSYNPHYYLNNNTDFDIENNYSLTLDGEPYELGTPLTLEDNNKSLVLKYGGEQTESANIIVAQSLQTVDKPVFETNSFTFTDKDFNYSEDGDAWTKNVSGYGYSNDGVQILEVTGEVLLTSKSSYTNVSSIVVTYNTNKSSGAGNLKAKIGNSDFIERSIGYSNTSSDGREAYYTETINFSKLQSGTVILSFSTTTNSIYVCSIDIITTNESINIANLAGHEKAQAAVVAFAQKFNSVMGASNVCSGTKTNLSSAWENAAIEYQKFLTSISSLSEEEQEFAKDMLKYANGGWVKGTDDDMSYCLQRAMATYDYCVSSNNLSEFMAETRTVTRLFAFKPEFSLFGENSILSETSSATWIITLVAVAGLAAVGGYFYTRKRKED